MTSNFRRSSSAASSPVVVESLETVTDLPAPLKVISPPADVAQVLQDSNHLGAAEPEKMGGADKDEAEDVGCDRLDIEDHHHHHHHCDEEDEEDYDEVVVNQTALNEVTSMTDRTSPWTSVLSDPDLASLESGEHAEDLNLEAPGGGGRRHRGVAEEDGSSLVGSGGDASDVDSDSEDVTLQDVPQELSEEEQEEEEEAGPSGTVRQAAGSQEGGQQAYPFSL